MKHITCGIIVMAVILLAGCVSNDPSGTNSQIVSSHGNNAAANSTYLYKLGLSELRSNDWELARQDLLESYQSSNNMKTAYLLMIACAHTCEHTEAIYYAQLVTSPSSHLRKKYKMEATGLLGWEEQITNAINMEQLLAITNAALVNDFEHGAGTQINSTKDTDLQQALVEQARDKYNQEVALLGSYCADYVPSYVIQHSYIHSPQVIGPWPPSWWGGFAGNNCATPDEDFPAK